MSKPMLCTDADIAAMEMDAEDQIEMNGTYDIDGYDFYALLARLAAAERCAGYLGTLAVYDTTMEVLLKEWQEVAGK